MSSEFQFSASLWNYSDKLITSFHRKQGHPTPLTLQSQQPPIAPGLPCSQVQPHMALPSTWCPLPLTREYM